MQLIQPMANLAFLTDDNGNRHCFSYNSEDIAEETVVEAVHDYFTENL